MFVKIGITSDLDGVDWNSNGGGGNGGGVSTSFMSLADSVWSGVAYTASAAVLLCGSSAQLMRRDGRRAEYCTEVAGRLWMLPCRNKCTSESFFAVL